MLSNDLLVFFLMNSLGNQYFLLEYQPRRDDIFVLRLSKKATDLDYSQDETLLWPKPKTLLWPKVWPFELFWTTEGCDQHLPLSAPLKQRHLEFAVLGALLNLAWYPSSSTLHLLRTYKGIWSEYFPTFKGNFSQVPCTDSPWLSAQKCAYAIANVGEMLLSWILRLWICRWGL